MDHIDLKYCPICASPLKIANSTTSKVKLKCTDKFCYYTHTEVINDADSYDLVKHVKKIFKATVQ